MGNGNFFKEGAKSKNGRFFRDLPGRKDGNFHKAASVQDQIEKRAEPGGEGTTGTGSGWHRPSTTQPTALEAGGSRFLQDNSGGGPVRKANLQSGLHDSKIHTKASQNSQMGKHASDMRFMGTSFEKLSADPDVTGTVKRDVRSLPSSMKDIGERGATSARRGLQGTWSWGKKTVSNAANTVADSPTLSLLALLGGGAMALRGGKKLTRAAIGRRKKPPAGMLANIRRKLAG